MGQWELILQKSRPWITPLCPAGHLPLKGGDRREACSPLFPKRSMWLRGRDWSISPLEGEMSGRTEGGETQHSAMPVYPHVLTR
ncbi:hypothetical protein BS627_11300 [Agrobacterium salinitolerans]|nr:hypothetical protein BS627_11300 [Agrobacterium salinitolerans]